MRSSTESAANGAKPDLRVLLQGAVATLDEKYRVPICLCYEQDFSQREAAAVLNVPERTVSDHIRTGLGKLRRALERAGYPAAVAAVLSGLKQTAPAVPASLAGRVETLVSSEATAAPRKLALRAARKRSTVKGGHTMKFIAGVVLASAVAGAVAVVGGGLGPVGAASPGERTDPAHDQKYKMTLTVRDEQKILDGPVEGAECVDVIKGLDLDDAGNWYWAESAYPALRVFRQETGRVYTAAGAVVCGLMDGPLESARFGGWQYNATNVIASSGDGKHVFVRDAKAGRIWRHIDFEAGVVRSLPPYQQRGKMHLIIVRDKSGEIYAFYSSGQDAPECPGYRKLKVAPFKTKDHYIGSPDDWALDAENMKFYWHGRGDIQVCDLKTGEVKNLTPGDGHKCASGPFEGMAFWCPTGMSISPGGRYIYVGGGDSSTCWRLDLEKRHINRWARGEDKLWKFGDGTHNDKGCRGVMGSSCWPAAILFAPDGHGAWPTCHGIYRLTPAK